jgi:hypothetical protein
MDPGAMIVAIVALVLGYRFLRFAIEQGVAQKNQRYAQAAAPASELLQRLDRLEKRMANLETIVLDREKKNEFERSL